MIVHAQSSPKAARVLWELVFFGGTIALGLAWTQHDTWTEAICGIAMVLAWLIMNGSSPLGWLLVIGICSVTEEHWTWYIRTIKDRFGGENSGHDSLMFCGVGYMVFLIVYLMHGFMLLPFDMWSIAHEAAKSIKIQPKAKLASKLHVGKLARSLAVNNVVALLFCLAQAAQVHWSRGSQGIRFVEGLPSKSEQLVCFFVGLAWNEFNFYYLHRLLHQPWWYRRFHKQHHEYTAPFALAAIYCSPLEMLVCNLWPFLGIASIWRFSGFFTYCWVANAIMGTQTHHSGYRWPWITIFDHQPNVHDLHHQSFTCNFGNVGLLDALHGTARDPFAVADQQKKQ